MADRLPTLEKAVRRHPDAPLFARLADAYLRRGMVLRALEVCEAGCERFPDYTTGHQVLSSCYEAHGDLDRAHRAMSRALRLDPENPAGFRGLSRLHSALGNPQLAVRSLRQALRLDPLNVGLTEELSQVARRVWAESQHKVEEACDPLAAQVEEAPAEQAAEEAAPDGAGGADVEPPPEVEEPAAAPQVVADETAEPSAGSETDGGEAEGLTGLGLRQDAELGRLLQEIDSQQARAQAVQVEPRPAVDRESAEARPEAEVEGPIPRISTVTLARIYSLQGLNQRAIEVYRQVLERDLENQCASDELAALEGKTRGH